MSAAARRAALAAIGQDLIAVSGDAGARRAVGLLGRPPVRPQACFDDLVAAPDWLRLPRAAQRRIAVRAALLAMAPALDASIDGQWLGELAQKYDDATLDWAIAQARTIPGTGLRAVPADDVEATGFALMRAALPVALQAYLDWAPASGASTPPALADVYVARAAESMT